MSAESKPDLELELAHLLLIDIVGYSRLLVNEQIEVLDNLNRLVRETKCFRNAEQAGKLIRLPTGDGMALLFFRSPEEPVNCALEISRGLTAWPNIRVRMGIHSGPVNQIRDVNDATNVAGAGINQAQRVMDCGDAGHILLSKHVADDLAHYGHWRPHLHDLGECEVKHRMRIHIFNLHKDGLGNPARPERLRRGHATASRWYHLRRSVRFGIIVLAAVFLVLAAYFFAKLSVNRRPTVGAALNILPEKSIAVLPFDNLSDDPQNAHFSDGVQDAILTALAKVADLKVISRTSVLPYRGKKQNIRDIGQQLGVSHVLEGTVQRSGDKVRLSAQLIDTRTDRHVWADAYDRAIADVFKLESDLAQTIANQLKAKLAPEEKAAIETSPSVSIGAYELYVRARTILASTTYTSGKQNRIDAIDFLDRAIQMDPSFLLAFCLLARVHSEQYLLGLDHTPARLALAEAALNSAKQLRPDSGEYHLALATYLYGGYLDYDQARKELEVARHLLPNESSVFELAGYINRRQGRWQESIRDLEHAVDLDPLNFDYLQQLSQSYTKTRDYERVVMTLDRALKIVPDDVGVRVKRASVALDWHADPKPLHQTLQEILEKNPELRRSLADDCIDLALCERDFAAADQALAVMAPEGGSLEGFVFPKLWYKASIQAARGDQAGARISLTAARAEVETLVRQQPDYAEALSILGLIDAGLGSKDEAIREGTRAVTLLPLEKDAINAPFLLEHLAVIYAWVGEKDRAFEQLARVTRLPGDLSFGQLKLRPIWDPLRLDPRFEKIVVSLAPK